MSDKETVPRSPPILTIPADDVIRLLMGSLGMTGQIRQDGRYACKWNGDGSLNIYELNGASETTMRVTPIDLPSADYVAQVGNEFVELEVEPGDGDPEEPRRLRIVQAP